jgi:antitoxin (DNA-binding transcriptional repressor) of toxin-antitoxin stability system
MAETVDLREAQVRLADLMARGETVVITRSGQEVARLGPPARREQRRPGRMRGRMWAAPDWDDADEDLGRAAEGGADLC